MYKACYVLGVIILLWAYCAIGDSTITKRSNYDYSVTEFATRRICWGNEICKEEFQDLFRCKCPSWSFCSSPGRYYNAVCTMTGTGYIWEQTGSGSWTNK